MNSRPLDEYKDDPRPCMQIHGYALIKATLLTQTFAAEVLPHIDAQPVGDLIPGKVDQVPLCVIDKKNLDKPDVPLDWWKAFEPRWQSIVIDAMTQAGACTEQEANSGIWKIHSEKGLRSKKGDGEQAPHWDATTGTFTRGKYTILMYLEPESRSTSLPKFPPGYVTTGKSNSAEKKAAMREDNIMTGIEEGDETSDDDDDGTRSDTQTAAMRECSHLLRCKEWYHDTMVKQGTIIIIDQSIVHHGVKCESNKRSVLYSYTSRVTTKYQDEHQFYLWQYMLYAHGPISPQFEQTVQEYEHDAPWEKHDDNVNLCVENTFKANITRSRRSLKLAIEWRLSQSAVANTVRQRLIKEMIDW